MPSDWLSLYTKMVPEQCLCVLVCLTSSLYLNLLFASFPLHFTTTISHLSLGMQVFDSEMKW